MIRYCEFGQYDYIDCDQPVVSQWTATNPVLNQWRGSVPSLSLCDSCLSLSCHRSINFEQEKSLTPFCVRVLYSINQSSTNTIDS